MLSLPSNMCFGQEVGLCYLYPMRQRLSILTLGVFLGMSTWALADATIGGKTVDCYCTDKTGGRIELGEQICLQVDGRMFMARCEMSLNVPMWRETGDGCLSSSLIERLQRLDPALNPRGIDPQIPAPKA